MTKEAKPKKDESRKSDYQKRQEKLLERAEHYNDPVTVAKIQTRLNAIPDDVRV